MYHFAIVALLGLAVWKVAGLVIGMAGRDTSSTVKTVLTLGIGILATASADYSVFAGWGVQFRYSWMGAIFTGLVVGSMAYVWHHVLGFVEAYGRRNRDQARALESTSPRAA